MTHNQNNSQLTETHKAERERLEELFRAGGPDAVRANAVAEQDERTKYLWWINH